MTSFAYFVVGNNKNAFFFCPMRLRSLDSGRLFSANTAFRDKPFIHLYSGGFAEPFSPPLRASLRARRSSLRRAPQGPPRPLTRGRGDTPAPARLHLLWRSRAYASHTRLATEKKRSHILLRFSCLPSFPVKRREPGVTGRQRPCAGSGGESLHAQKRARSGGIGENN